MAITLQQSIEYPNTPPMVPNLPRHSLWRLPTFKNLLSSNASASQNLTIMAMLRRALQGLHKTLNTTYLANKSSIAASPLRSHLCSASDSESFKVDLSDEENKRRILNRLVYRSRQRGLLELDLVLGNWVKENISSMDASRVKELADVLNLENPDLWKWLTGQEQPPEAVNSNLIFSAIRDKVMGNLSTHSSPETRATPGQPWVRGWDDFKKGRDSPIVGNQ